MAMRPRGGGAAAAINAGRVPAVIEDFTPISKWEEDDQSHILNIHLHGFTKEQINVSADGHTIMVKGNRFVGHRFHAEFHVPKNGDMNSVSANLQDGILRITFPKIAADDVQKQAPAIIKEDQDKVLPEKKQQQQQKTPVGSASVSQSVGQEKSLESQDAFTRERDKERSEAKENNIIASEMVRKKNAVGTKELPEKTGADRGATGIPENNKELYGNEIYKKALKGLTELNEERQEERQLLVNIGVAMLVVVALTAYVTYKFASSGKDKN